jgi:hypothetical protein
MDKYTPTELHDVHNMKKRVMNNVNTYVRSHHVKQKRFNWRFATLTTIFTLCIVGYIGYELYYKANLQDPDQSVIAEPGENNTGVIDAAPFDFTRPNITIDDDKFYIEGVTLGDSIEQVTSIFGQNFTSHSMNYGITRIDYDNVVSFNFQDETLTEITLYVVDEQYIKEIYEAYNGLKEKTDFQYFIYNEADTQAIKAEQTDNALYVYFIQPTPPDGDVSSLEDIEPAPIDFTHPKITVVNNMFNIEGVSIGNSLEKVTSVIGKNYISNTNVEGPIAVDIEIVYDNIATFKFYKNQLIKVYLFNVNKEYYEEIFNASNMIKIEEEDMTILYIKESNQSIKAEIVENNNLILYIGNTGPEFHYHYGDYIK